MDDLLALKPTVKIVSHTAMTYYHYGHPWKYYQWLKIKIASSDSNYSSLSLYKNLKCEEKKEIISYKSFCMLTTKVLARR